MRHAISFLVPVNSLAGKRELQNGRRTTQGPNSERMFLGVAVGVDKKIVLTRHIRPFSISSKVEQAAPQKKLQLLERFH